ncbi:MAG: ribonuclease P protein component [Candidatus Omnitrophica bacterium]|nr:ribonuclease P protein component [Candidatus Omnitrophota bacterium]
MNERLRFGQRIRDPLFFKKTVREGQFARGFWINLWVIETARLISFRRTENKAIAQTGPCLGIVVSRKVNKRATVRNLWKRRIREVFRKNQTLIQNGHTLVIQAKIKERVPLYTELEKEIKKLYEKSATAMKKATQ